MGDLKKLFKRINDRSEIFMNSRSSFNPKLTREFEVRWKYMSKFPLIFAVPFILLVNFPGTPVISPLIFRFSPFLTFQVNFPVFSVISRLSQLHSRFPLTPCLQFHNAEAAGAGEAERRPLESCRSALLWMFDPSVGTEKPHTCKMALLCETLSFVNSQQLL